MAASALPAYFCVAASVTVDVTVRAAAAHVSTLLRILLRHLAISGQQQNYLLFNNCIIIRGICNACSPLCRAYNNTNSYKRQK